MRRITLREIAYARSGDKGNSSNIGVIAYTREGYQYLVQELTVVRVFDFIRPLGVQKIVRYELPNLQALNFVCAGILAGGGSLSLRIDSQGKALGEALLELRLTMEEDQLLKCVQGASCQRL